MLHNIHVLSILDMSDHLLHCLKLSNIVALVQVRVRYRTGRAHRRKAKSLGAVGAAVIYT